MDNYIDGAHAWSISVYNVLLTVRMLSFFLSVMPHKT